VVQEEPVEISQDQQVAPEEEGDRVDQDQDCHLQEMEAPETFLLEVEVEVEAAVN